MIRPARAGDAAAIEAFLARHAETSMFLRGNLRNQGLFDCHSLHGTEFWLVGDTEILAVFGWSNAGFVMSQAPQASRAAWQAFARAMAGRKLAGITGVPAQVAQAKSAFGVTRAAFGLDAPEPLYQLALDDLAVPNLPGTLRPPAETDRELLFRWTRAYSAELHMSAPERLDDEAHGRTDRAIASGDVRLLEIGGTPVAMTAFNARLPDTVQIGGVYTPPGLRGRGHARRAVALHLVEARGQGVRTAILFASGAAACRAYEAIGFEHIGEYMLAILANPVVIGGGS